MSTRRAFLGGAAGTVGAAVAVILLPRGRVQPALGAMTDGDWHVDDICGHMPRYAHPIPYMHDTARPDLTALAAPVDRQFVA